MAHYASQIYKQLILLINMSLASAQMFKQTNLNSKVYFTIEGNIGCGKSTFLEQLKQRIPELYWIQEPVDDWQSVGNDKTNMLERYYQQPKRWGFTFQIYAIFTRLKKMKDACNQHPEKIKISERSILADKYVFSSIMKQLSYMDEAENEIFKSLFPTFSKMAPIEKAKIIYLRCAPQKCHERALKRKRVEEKAIPLEYIEMIHQKHQQWFAQYDPKKVLIIDTTQDFKNNEQKLLEMVKNLSDFIKNGSP